MFKKINLAIFVLLILAAGALDFADESIEEIKANIDKSIKVLLDGKNYDTEIITYNNEVYIALSDLEALTNQKFLFNEDSNTLKVGNDGIRHLVDAKLLKDSLRSMYFTTNKNGTSIKNTESSGYSDYRVDLNFYQDITTIGGEFENNNPFVLPVTVKDSDYTAIAHYKVPANGTLKWEIDVRDMAKKNFTIQADSSDRGYSKVTDYSINNLYYVEMISEPIPKDINVIPSNAKLFDSKEIIVQHDSMYFQKKSKWNKLDFDSSLLTKEDSLGLDYANDYRIKLNTVDIKNIGGVLLFDDLDSHRKTVTVYIKSKDGEVLGKYELQRGIPCSFNINTENIDEIEIIQDSGDRGNKIIYGYGIYNLYKVNK